MFKFLSLRIKLTLAFLLLAGIFCAVSYYQVQAIQHFDGIFLKLVDVDSVRLNALDSFKLELVKLRDQTYELQHSPTTNKAALQTLSANLVAISTTLSENNTNYHQLIREDKTPIAKSKLTALDRSVAQVAIAAQVIVSSINTGKIPLPDGLITNLASSQDQFDIAVTDVINAEQQAINADDTEADATIDELLRTTTVLALVAAGVAMIFGLAVSTRIAQLLGELQRAARRIANGDFSQPARVRSHDEIGQLATNFNQMAERLKDSYRRLAVERQRDEAILQSMGEGLIAIDEQQKIVLINQVALELLGFANPNEATGKTLQEAYRLYDPDDKQHLPLPADQRPGIIAITKGQSADGIYRFQKADGRAYLLSVHANPVKLEDRVVGAVIVLRDVTKEREVDRMKTEFISLASHQLRTPLSAIKWFSEMLVQGDAGQLQPEQLDFAKNIADSTERMIELVGSLLNISRIESGRIMVEPQPTNLQKLVAGIVNDLQGKLREKQQNLVISVHDSLPDIMLDPRLIGQVYLNLLTNAIKYTPKGGEISVFISRKEGDVISQVTDNGYGIPKAQQSRVFEKFFRADNAVKIETDGTGLGLYLIKAVIESSGGKIWFESEEGKGTTFWFSIPVSGMKAKKGEVTLDS